MLDHEYKPVKKSIAQILKLYFRSEDLVEQPKVTLKWELVTEAPLSLKTSPLSGTITINLSVIEIPTQD